MVCLNPSGDSPIMKNMGCWAAISQIFDPRRSASANVLGPNATILKAITRVLSGNDPSRVANSSVVTNLISIFWEIHHFTYQTAKTM